MKDEDFFSFTFILYDLLFVPLPSRSSVASTKPRMADSRHSR